jgi:hypothetical protein
VFHGGKEAREAMVRYEWAMPPGGAAEAMPVGGAAQVVHRAGEGEAIPAGGGSEAIPLGEGGEPVPSLPFPPLRGKYGAPLEWCEDPKFDVCITSYEVMVGCAELFRRRVLLLCSYAGMRDGEDICASPVVKSWWDAPSSSEGECLLFTFVLTGRTGAGSRCWGNQGAKRAC